jgi:hypothetical protein
VDNLGSGCQNFFDMPSDPLTAALHEIARDDVDGAAMIGIAARLSARHTLREVIASTLRQPWGAAKSGQSALFHANGFYKVVLASTGRAQIRVHIWPGNRRWTQPVENVHNHRWSFATQVLCGAYNAATYDPADGMEYTKYAYTPGLRAAEYTLADAGICDLALTTYTTHTAGSAYWINSRVLHRVTPHDRNELTATLVVIGPARRADTQVFVSRDAAAAVVGGRPHRPLGGDEVTGLLTDLSAKLRC